MRVNREVEQIKAQIIDTERMLELAANHPVMSQSFISKLRSLRRKLETFNGHQVGATVKFLFSGSAVIGSLGIKSSFASKVLRPIQELVKTQTALVRFGAVGERGQARDSSISQLYLTSLPHGSFGLELSHMGSNDMFAEGDVKEGISQVVNLIEASASSDDAFEAAIENTPKRNIENLKVFLKHVSDENSFLNVDVGESSLIMSSEEVKTAFHRVSETVNDQEEVFVIGTLRGILLDSSKFEIINAQGEQIHGIVNPDISDDQLIAYDREFLNASCRVHLIKHTTTFVTGVVKVSYELIEITAVPT